MIETWGIDAGHGGENHGVCENGIIEKNWTLAQAFMLRAILEACHIDAVMVRSSAGAMSLKERAARADELGCTRIISLHLNAGPPGWSKARVLVHPNTSDANAKTAARLASELPPELSSPTSRFIYKADREDWGDARAVVDAYRQPVILVEFAFASNERDARALQDDSVRTRANLAIAMGIA